MATPYHGLRCWWAVLDAGILELAEGKGILRVEAIAMKGTTVMDLKAVVLERVAQ